MKFQPDQLDGVNVISRHDTDSIQVNADRYAFSMLVPARGEVQPWPVSDFAELTAEHFQQLLSLEPELVIFGSGAKLRFVKPALLRPLIDRHIGVETMDTGAACRTYNVLASEGRAVVAALLVEPDAG
jgi:uncharacterized protein